MVEMSEARKHILKECKPWLIQYLKDVGHHEPRTKEGDLLRWTNGFMDGIRFNIPSVRRDMVEKAAAGKVMVRGDIDLIDFILSKLLPSTASLFWDLAIKQKEKIEHLRKQANLN